MVSFIKIVLILHIMFIATYGVIMLIRLCVSLLYCLWCYLYSAIVPPTVIIVPPTVLMVLSTVLMVLSTELMVLSTVLIVPVLMVLPTILMVPPMLLWCLSPHIVFYGVYSATYAVMVCHRMVIVFMCHPLCYCGVYVPLVFYAAYSAMPIRCTTVSSLHIMSLCCL